MIRLFNTRSQSEEPFEPLSPPDVRIYTCGPTVYNVAHIGNFRAYVFEDLLHRHLAFRGYRVDRVMNLTDVDDKTIRGARQARTSLAEFTAPFKKAFFEDLETLRIRSDIRFPAATDPEHIARMIAMIGTLLERGHAYLADDGSIYFRLASFPNYGRLARLNLDELRPSGRVRSDEYEKESVGDFALWKAWDDEDGDVAWESPWGRGRPGWHIECSAMATGLLGPSLDIHCGAVDNIFPHHEAEIAQSEACTGKPFVKYWLHCAHLVVDGQKMSKSLGNFYTLRDLLEKGWTGREIRYALLSVRYRQQLNFTLDGLAAARSALTRLDEWAGRLAAAAGQTPPGPGAHPLRERFAAALDADLNISEALGHLFDTVRESNRLLDRDELPPADAATLLAAWRDLDAILALRPDAADIPADIRVLLDRRRAARDARDWATSDALRDRIQAAGWTLKDTRDGQKITRAS